MTVHQLDATPSTVTDVFDCERPPVLTVDPGDSVTVRTLDAGGCLARPRAPGLLEPRILSNPRGHCLTGPIAIRGANVGAVLSVHLVSLRPDTWGWTAAATRDTQLMRRLGLADSKGSWLLWDLDVEHFIGTSHLGHTVDLAPFLGIIGLPPDEPGEHPTLPPRVRGGGNIDCRSLVAGSTLYLPVTVAGGLVYVGDGHGAQGDGEVGGTAIECGMTTDLELGLINDPPIPGIHAVTPDSRVTFGFDKDLNEATGDALSAMLVWMQVLYGLPKAEALALASPVVDLRITQVANDVWGVHAVLPLAAIR